jgi:N-acetyl-gamma-glutamyl-phosphate reductase
MVSSAVTRVAVVGASGYTGAELLRLLVEHPSARITMVCAARQAGQPLARVFPHFAGRLEVDLEPFDADRAAAAAEVIFTALPHGASAAAVAALCERGRAVIDLSADFRLRDARTYAAWYGGGDAHPAPALLKRAVYGLPELGRDAIRGAQLVACPGCYPTAAVLAVAPLLARGKVRTDSLVVDAKSGASGAGREPSAATHLAEAAEGVRPYKVAGEHRHTPEIEQALSAVAGAPVTVAFTPHLLPMSRGLLACVYARAVDPTVAEDSYRSALVAAYEREPFITVLEAGRLPDTAHVRGSNRVQVAVRRDRRTDVVLAMAALDNLVKGAAGQALQCFNLMRGYPETSGLEGVALFP